MSTATVRVPFGRRRSARIGARWRTRRRPYVDREHSGSAASAGAEHSIVCGRTGVAAAGRWCPVTLGRRSDAQLVTRHAAGDDWGDAASLLQKVQMPLHVREAREQSRPLRLPLQLAGDLEGRRRLFEQDRRDVVGPLAAVGAQPGVQHGHLGEGKAVTGEHDSGIKSNEAWQSGQVLDQAVAAACPIVAFEAGDGDDAGQQVIATEQDTGRWVPQRQMTLGVPGADHTHELTTARGQEVAIPDTEFPFGSGDRS